MAATHYSPNPVPEDIEDPVTYEEASALLARTGHPASESTLRRYVRDDGIPTARVRGRTGKSKDVMSWTAILEAHGRRTAAKLRASGDWP
jgi:hypothetical protein